MDGKNFGETQSLSFSWQGHEDLLVEISPTDSIASLATRLSEVSAVTLDHMTIWIDRSRRLRRPFPTTPVSEVIKPSSKLRFVGTPSTLIPSLGKSSAPEKQHVQKTPVIHRRDWKRMQEDSTYTFHDIQPLPYLPNPEKSQRFLKRLADDPGIKSAMRMHHFSVGLLTEMDPSQHTTHDSGGGVSRTLGLNRNGGEVIELRLRTDRYDGYRDYKVIRTTLCHELAHNVFGPHDRSFYDLMKKIQEEVDRDDWKHGGHRLTDEEFYNPTDDGEYEHIDSGGWTGGEFVLGSLNSSERGEGLTRREILAKAAMRRLEKQRQKDKDDTES